MKTGPIVDAGPALNFFASGHERLLFSCIGGISVPESVLDEILKKSEVDQRFRNARRVVSRLPNNLWQVLSDTVTGELNQVIYRLERMPMEQRMRNRRDLGETMVIAHAVAAAQNGQDVFILMDERRGSQVAAHEGRRLERMRQQNVPVGSLRIINTVQVLRRAVMLGHIQDRGAMRRVYGQLNTLDDGLVHIEQTGLLDKDLWRGARQS